MCLTAASSTTVGVLWVCDCNGEEDEEFEEHNCVEGNEAQRPSHCAVAAREVRGWLIVRGIKVTLLFKVCDQTRSSERCGECEQQQHGLHARTRVRCEAGSNSEVAHGDARQSEQQGSDAAHAGHVHAAGAEGANDAAHLV